MQGRDPLEDVGRGQPVKFLATTINAWNAAARAEQRRRLGGIGTPELSSEIDPSLTVLVENNSGADLWPGAVLQLGAPIVGWGSDQEAAGGPLRTRPAYAGVTPTRTDGAIAILLDGVRDTLIGRAVIQGHAVTYVDVLDAGHEFAEPVPGQTNRLRSAPAGPVRILALGPSDSDGAGSGESGSDSGSDGGIHLAAVLLGAGESAESAEVAVVIKGFVADQRDADCGSGDACGSGQQSGDRCPPIFHFAAVQEYRCGAWCDVGCCWVVEVLGRRLETGRRYKATRIGTAADSFQAILLPADETPCQTASALYLVDAGSPTRSILVGARLGKFCADGSGLEGDSESESVGDLSGNLAWYYGTVFYYDAELCGWVFLESCLVANPKGCGLRSGERVAGLFNRMVPNSFVSAAGGSGGDDGGCLPSYLAIVGDHSGVYDIKCCSEIGGVQVITYADACGRVRIQSCGCGDGAGSGPGISLCGFEAVPTCYATTISGVANGGCLECASFNRTYTLCLTGTDDDGWVETATVSLCGILSLARTLKCETIEDQVYMVFRVEGDVAVYRKLLSEWVPFGANTMSLYTSLPTCTNWPATITMSPA